MIHFAHLFARGSSSELVTMPPSNMSWDVPVVPEDYEKLRNGQVTRRVSSKTMLSLDPIAECPSIDTSSKRRRPRQKRMVAFRTANAIIWSVILYFLIHQYNLSGEFEEFHEEPLPALHQSMEKMKDISTLNTEQPEVVDGDFIHIIHTRFMQNQPHLIHLGLARLELMKAFTIESLAQQTSQNFLWVIRTDPNLNATLKEPILEALKDHGHHLLMADNENPNVQIHELRDVDAASIWSGDLVGAKQYLNSKQKVIETRLDADDALASTFVETIQASAKKGLSLNEPSWQIWCASRHLDWQYHSVFEEEQDDDDEEPLGALFSLRQQGCIATGLSIVYTEGISHSDLPPIKHDQLPNRVEHCKKNKKKTKCLDFLDIKPTVLRARTPTSAGMLNIMFKQKGKAKRQYEKGAMTQREVQDPLWIVSESVFGYAEDTATRLHKYLEANIRLIAIDNLHGQCTLGHSCKESSKKLLQAIVDRPELI